MNASTPATYISVVPRQKISWSFDVTKGPIDIDRNSFLNAVYRASMSSPDMSIQFNALCNNRVIQRGEILYRQGEEFSSVAVSVDGIFRIYDERSSIHDELTTGFIKPGDLIPTMSTIKGCHELGHSIEALTRAKIKFLPRDHFLELIDSDIRWYRITWNLLYEEISHKERRERSLLISSAFARYHDFLIEFADIEYLIKLKHIASYLGIQPSTLSRIRSSPYRIE